MPLHIMHLVQTTRSVLLVNPPLHLSVSSLHSCSEFWKSMPPFYCTIRDLVCFLSRVWNVRTPPSQHIHEVLLYPPLLLHLEDWEV